VNICSGPRDTAIAIVERVQSHKPEMPESGANQCWLGLNGIVDPGKEALHSPATRCAGGAS
jgi:hypothetical protein